MSVRAPVYQGSLQGIGNGQALGWCWEPGAPARPVRIAITVDGEIVAEGRADIARPDLAEHGDGAHGFLIGLPDSLQAPARRRVLALAGPERVPLPPAPSFWQEARQGNGWSGVVFEPGEPPSESMVMAEVPQPPVAANRRAVVEDGWLFDARELEPPGAEPTPERFDALIDTLSDAAAALASLGIAYIPATVPAKRWTILPASFPDRGIAERGWIGTLSARLRDVDGVELLDLLPVLQAAAAHGAVYRRTDTDWSDHGAFFVARALLKEAHKHVHALRPPGLADLHLRAVSEYHGALADSPRFELLAGDELRPVESRTQAEAAMVIDASELRALRMPVESQLAQAGRGHVRVYENHAREEDTRVAVIGDEGSLSLVLWLAETTRRTTFFCAAEELPLAQVQLELPAVVFHLVRERYLLALLNR